MFTFDIEQSAEKSVLVLSGRLQKEDAENLERLMQNSLTGVFRLTVKLDNVKEISNPCQNVFRSIIDELKGSGKHLLFTGRSRKK
jgi:ABC-type transporter Mla MlaB component